MDIVIVVLLIVIIAALAFAWMKFRPGAHGGAGGVRGPAGGVRASRGADAAARHDPMAEAVERHAMATDPHEAAEAELRLQAQANRVASDLHARQASDLESQAHGADGRGHAVPAQTYEQPGYAPDTRPVYEDEHGRPVYEDGTPAYDADRPVADGQPVYDDGRPAANGRPVYREDPPRY